MITTEQYQTEATAEQRTAIERQAAYYATPDCPAAGLHSFRVYPASEWGDDTPGSVAVDFTYVYEDNSSAFGLETTIFAADGKVTDSQDFG